MYYDYSMPSMGPTLVEHEMIESQLFLRKKSHGGAFVIDIKMLLGPVLLQEEQSLFVSVFFCHEFDQKF